MRPYRPKTLGADDLLPSVLDGDRCRRLCDAVEACVECFRREQAYAPRVLDFACGGGALSAAALRAGAAFVVAVDCNEDSRRIARDTLVRGGFVEGAHFALQARAAGDEGDAQLFDVVVADLLGTHVWSQSAPHVYATDVAPCARRFAAHRPWYVVPQRLEQFARVVRFDALLAPGGGARWSTFARVAPLPHAGSAALAVFDTRELPVPFHLSSYEAVTERCPIAIYDVGTKQAFVEVTAPRAVLPPTASPGDARFVVLEWRAQLWDALELVNTLESYAAIPACDAYCRAHSWGVSLAALPAWQGPATLEWSPTHEGAVRLRLRRAPRAGGRLGAPPRKSAA